MNPIELNGSWSQIAANGTENGQHFWSQTNDGESERGARAVSGKSDSTILLINISTSEKKHQLWKSIAPKELKL